MIKEVRVHDLGLMQLVYMFGNKNVCYSGVDKEICVCGLGSPKDVYTVLARAHD